MYVVDSSAVRRGESERPSWYLGHGVFETMRVRRNQAAGWSLSGFRLHCERLISGARALALFVPSAKALEVAAVSEIESCSEPGDLILRFVAGKNQVLVFAEKYVPHSWVESGVSLQTVCMTRAFPEYKHASALVSIESDRQAKEAGFDTALLAEADGLITECSWANFLWLNAETELCTNMKGVLPGVTQALLASFVSVTHKPLTVAAMKRGECKAAIVSQATSGVVPVTRINSTSFLDEQRYACKKLIAPFIEAFQRCELPGTLSSN